MKEVVVATCGSDTTLSSLNSSHKLPETRHAGDAGIKTHYVTGQTIREKQEHMGLNTGGRLNKTQAPDMRGITGGRKRTEGAVIREEKPFKIKQEITNYSSRKSKNVNYKPKTCLNPNCITVSCNSFMQDFEISRKQRQNYLLMSRHKSYLAAASQSDWG